MRRDKADRQRRSVTLVGFMGAGKSKIGRLLARQLQIPFADTDREIEAAEGMSVAEIFAARGEADFRRAEREAIAHLLGSDPQVIALGGGAFVDPDNRARLNEATVTVWLDPPFDVLLSRVARSSTRPLASGKSASELRQLWEQRRQSYAEAHLRVITSNADPQRFVDEIVARLDPG